VTPISFNPSKNKSIINPQANIIFERKAINDINGSFYLKNDENLEEKKIIHMIPSFNINHGFQAIRSTFHTTLQAKPFYQK
jgi:hypothetical protein